MLSNRRIYLMFFFFTILKKKKRYNVILSLGFNFLHNDFPNTLLNIEILRIANPIKNARIKFASVDPFKVPNSQHCRCFFASIPTTRSYLYPRLDLILVLLRTYTSTINRWHSKTASLTMSKSTQLVLYTFADRI